jgi:hypothetical protein
MLLRHTIDIKLNTHLEENLEKKYLTDHLIHIERLIVLQLRPEVKKCELMLVL